MWIRIVLVAFFVGRINGGKVDECQILQTTDPKTPCYILVRNSGNLQVPPFVYLLNLPRPTSQLPCPLSQTLDASLTCYVEPRSLNDPSFILNAQLPPNADDLDESPAGKLKLREAKAIPVFSKISAKPVFPPPSRPLGPPSAQLTMALLKSFPSNHQSDATVIKTPAINGRPVSPLSYTALQQYQTRPVQTVQYRTPLRQNYALSSSQSGSFLRYYYPYSKITKQGPVSPFRLGK